MYLTQEILEKEKACSEGLKWFERFYPNGAELIDVIKTRHIPSEFLHWGRGHLSNLTPAEIATYEQVCGIVNSTYVIDSKNVRDSHFVINSTEVDKSSFVRSSEKVSDSSDVYRGTSIKHSSKISESIIIQDSEAIVLSENIKHSFNIADSSFVINSNNVYAGKIITESSYIMRSENLKDCHFVDECLSVNHALFCYNVKGGNKDYLLFNQPIQKEQWEWIKETFDEMVKNPMHLSDFQDKETLNCGATIHRIQSIWFDALDSEFINWIKKLPGYNGMLMYTITLNPTFLQ